MGCQRTLCISVYQRILKLSLKRMKSLQGFHHCKMATTTKLSAADCFVKFYQFIKNLLNQTLTITVKVSFSRRHYKVQEIPA